MEGAEPWPAHVQAQAQGPLGLVCPVQLVTLEVGLQCPLAPRPQALLLQQPQLLP